MEKIHYICSRLTAPLVSVRKMMDDSQTTKTIVKLPKKTTS